MAKLCSSNESRGAGIRIVRNLTLNLAVGYTCKLTFVDLFVYAEFSWISFANFRHP